MWKIVAGIAGVIIVLGGGYWVLKGSGPAVTSATDTYGQGNTLAYATSTGGVASQGGNASGSTQVNPSSTNPNKKMTATIQTSMGDITVEFYGDQAPKAVENFVKLAQTGYYDNTKFHRIIKGFMNQGGDPLTKDETQKARWGTGGPGYTIQDEFGMTYKNTAGTLAMANTGAPNSSGSQFFINAVDNEFLDGKYTVFGKVTAGMDVVTKMNNVPTDSGDRPLTPVVLKSVQISQ